MILGMPFRFHNEQLWGIMSFDLIRATLIGTLSLMKIPNRIETCRKLNKVY